jgi:hypothetical protein
MMRISKTYVFTQKMVEIYECFAFLEEIYDEISKLRSSHSQRDIQQDKNSLILN